jgi:hypothetical protein
MTPQLQHTVAVNVGHAGAKACLDTLVLKIYYDGDGGTPTDAEAEAQTSSTQNGAIITWTQSTDTFAIEPSGAGTTWFLGSSSSPASLPGDFTFVFSPGKVASESVGPAVWQLWARVVDDGAQSATNYDNTPPTMNWYGEIAVSTTSVDWGTVGHGSDYDANPQTGISVTYISNGDYDQRVRSDATWTGAATNATYDATGACDDAQEFSLLAYDADILGSAVQVDTSGVSIDATGTQTGETGSTVSTNALWLKVAPVFAGDTYSGDITYIIADR